MSSTRPSAPSDPLSTAPSRNGGANVPPHVSVAQSPERVSLQPDLFDPLAALLHAHADQFRPEFAAWLALNRHVFKAFAYEADRVWRRGRRHYSPRTILEHLRHESALSETSGEWKINNNAQSGLSRLYLLLHPERAGFFEQRDMPGSKRAAA